MAEKHVLVNIYHIYIDCNVQTGSVQLASSKHLS